MQDKVHYLHLVPGSDLPTIQIDSPFRAVLISEFDTVPAWQAQVSNWLVTSGCLYLMAHGTACSTWDDSVDAANLAKFHYGDIPDDQFVMTTWHEDESLEEVFWYSKNCAIHPNADMNATLLLHIALNQHKDLILSGYHMA